MTERKAGSGRLPHRVLRLRPQDVERFWPKVRRGDPGACWPWLASFSDRGYGIFWLPRLGMVPSHRVAYHLAHGDALSGAFVMHACDNRACCNPAHLRAGTHRDNMADMCSKNRQAKGDTIARHKMGDKNHFARLSDRDAADIRRRYAAGEQSADLARAFNVTRPTITRCVNGFTFRHLSGASERKLSHAEAQRVGVAARHRMRAAALPDFLERVRGLVASGQRPTVDRCKRMPGYYRAIAGVGTHSALVDLATRAELGGTPVARNGGAA